MAVITALDLDQTIYNVIGDKGAEVVSAVAGVSDSVELTEGTTAGFDINLHPHHFIAVRTYTDAAGTVQALGTGTFTVKIMTTASRVFADDPNPQGTIDASVGDTLNWSGNTRGVKVTVTAALGGGIVAWRVALTSNRQ